MTEGSTGPRRLLCAAALLLLGVLGGCATTPYAGRAEDHAAKAFQASEQRGVVYVYRRERFGAEQPMPLYLDDRFMGRTRGQTFFRWEVKPGAHEIRTGFGDGQTLRLEVRPGAIYYLWQEIRVGEDGLDSRLNRVKAARGQRGVRQCTLLVSAR